MKAKLKDINYLKTIEYVNIFIYALLIVAGISGRLFLNSYFKTTIENDVSYQLAYMVQDIEERSSESIHVGIYPEEYSFVIRNSSDVVFSTSSWYLSEMDGEAQEFYAASERILGNKSNTRNIVNVHNGYVLFVTPILNGAYFLEGSVPFDVAGAWTKRLIVFYDVFVLVFSAFALANILHIRGVNRKVREDDEVRKAAEVAEEANRAKSDFLANMSHEIRTPINSVLGLNEMILRESHEDEILEYAEDIKSAGESLLSLVNDILDFSKIEAGRMELYESDYETTEMFNDLNNMTSVRAHAKNLKFVTSIDQHIPLILNGDRLRVQQIIINLLTNAVKYTDSGSVTLRAYWDEEIQSLRVSVIDTGKGIAEGDIKLLFEKFQRVNLKENSNIEGTGLGLSIVKQLLDKMGGSMHVQSTVGEGSTFTVIIPQKKVGNAEIGIYDIKTHKRSVEYRELFTAPDAKILVVDDTKMNLMVIEKLLKKTEIKVDTVNNGEDAIDMIRNNAYDIIFLDIRMPRMGGEEVLETLKAKHLGEDVPTIALTADALPESKSKYISEGFTDYLSKPVKPSDLEELIVRYLPKDKVTYKREVQYVKPAQEIPDDKRKQLFSHLSEYIDTKNTEALRSMLGALSRQDFPDDMSKAISDLAEAFKVEDYDGMKQIINRELKEV